MRRRKERKTMKSIKSKFTLGVVGTVVVFTTFISCVSVTLHWNTNPNHTKTMILLFLAILMSAVISYLVARVIAAKIADPMLKCIQRMELIAEGDFHTPMPEVNTQDETKIVRDTCNTIICRLNSLIEDEKRVLGAMANGDLTEEPRAEVYAGDVVVLYDAFRKISTDMSSVFFEMKNVAEQVAAGANQVSDGAQGLSQGATEQAASVEELAATIHNLADQIEDTKNHAEKVDQLATVTCGSLGNSNTKMNELREAMNLIDETSESIGKIIKAIEDIAFQTNILALNAAVEAARAGEAGKGFAVVADEVRALAAKSAEASKGTEELIEKSREAVLNGNRIVNETYDLMEGTVQNSDQVIGSIHGILEAAVKQNEAVQQINLGVDQISAVVQTNSATSEESAAASEELSAQAVHLDSIVSAIKIS